MIISTLGIIGHNWSMIISLTYVICFIKFRDHSVYASSQWEMALHCNTISHWLGAYTEWSLKFTLQWILCMRPTNETWRYTVTSSLIGWAHTQNDPWSSHYNGQTLFTKDTTGKFVVRKFVWSASTAPEGLCFQKSLIHRMRGQIWMTYNCT